MSTEKERRAQAAYDRRTNPRKPPMCPRCGKEYTTWDEAVHCEKQDRAYYEWASDTYPDGDDEGFDGPR